MEDIESGQVDCVVVYKVDRLSRSLLDFARLIRALGHRGDGECASPIFSDRLGFTGGTGRWAPSQKTLCAVADYCSASRSMSLSTHTIPGLRLGTFLGVPARWRGQPFGP
jgi:Resolvase, N terminal domain